MVLAQTAQELLALQGLDGIVEDVNNGRLLRLASAESRSESGRRRRTVVVSALGM